MSDCILPLGDPGLRVICEAVTDVGSPVFREENQRLKATLDSFRSERGFGRGIAAPQIGIPKRFISINFGEGTHSLINPEIKWRSPETFTLWDDCMCFPDLLVRVRRNLSISISFMDESGGMHEWKCLGQAESELLQHELDHLNGVLAVDLALDSQSIIKRSAFDASPDTYRTHVDYVIQPTI